MECFGHSNESPTKRRQHLCTPLSQTTGYRSCVQFSRSHLNRANSFQCKHVNKNTINLRMACERMFCSGNSEKNQISTLHVFVFVFIVGLNSNSVVPLAILVRMRSKWRTQIDSNRLNREIGFHLYHFYFSHHLQLNGREWRSTLNMLRIETSREIKSLH